ncbi:hypothetical protein PTSG_11995 [Salpingoeca rosetta]|uniref:Carboxylic ester hydrolase n=1 Tax=Salpingoeca rosetta (strain ATCC 50818 / BSB-021) TaxID=946362 RepID=F2U4U9_SALR5|nr:uncharacterized protein PTSG_11995 [Salpingoeca rosetta]EGD82665.1 hypothetical protein PTSG_11995 [Salpingoeca rosetta]|eukprot:XP_004995901.1 hypothetical protein PTSG_11995 [Salpingoeca rosetta]
MMTKSGVLLLVLGALTAHASACASAGAGAGEVISDTTIIHTAAGDVIGKNLEDHDVTAFMGIPYAQMPAGRRRFAPPVPKQPWKGVMQATEYGDTCYTAGDVHFGNSGLPTSEDCLHINVFVPPNTTTTSNKPVVVFIHGGGFIMGASNFPVVSPRPFKFLVECDCVYVNFNYRLGPLGFIALEEMRQEHGHAGVLGLMDQQLALQWVQNNIRAFGGDPAQVTVMGESAGAFCLCFHLVSPQSAGLFQRVIMQSSMCDMKFQSYEEAVDQGNRLAKHVGCGDAGDRLACLRSLPAEKIQRAFNNKRGLLLHTGVRWFPTVDGVVIPDYPVSLMRQHKHNKVDVIIGNNADEASLFLLIAYNVAVFESSWRDLLPATFAQDQLGRVAALFPQEWSPFQKMAALLDNMSSCSTLRTAMALASSPESHVFVYHYTFVPETLGWPFDQLGAFHGSELRYVFEGEPEMSDAEKHLSQTIQDLWYAFARGSTHNLSSGEVHWPRLDDQHPVYLDLHNGNLSARSTKPIERWEDTQHRLEDHEPLFVNESEPSPFAFCPFFDTLLSTEKKLMAPPADFEEAWDSFLVNVVLVKLIKQHGRTVLAVLLTLAVIVISRRCYPTPLTTATRPPPSTSHEHAHTNGVATRH